MQAPSAICYRMPAIHDCFRRFPEARYRAGKGAVTQIHKNSYEIIDRPADNALKYQCQITIYTQS
jgi:hypothetical protein